jgi:hypothetical protein
MKSNYEEKKAARLEAYQNRAAKNDKISDQSYETAKEIGSWIPPGQPILVGHHSERRHRRDIEKIDNNMRKSVEARSKAAYYRDRAESLLNNTAISSDDPNAIDKLQEKLERLEGLQELMKAVNKIIKTKKVEAEKVTDIMELGLKESTAVKIMNPQQFGGPGFASFTLTNNNAKIRSTKQRIQYLEKVAKIESSEEMYGDIKLVISSEDNRVQIFFPGKPSEEIRKQVKSMGFHWSYTVGAWMRQISNYSIYAAKEFLKKQVA